MSWAKLMATSKKDIDAKIRRRKFLEQSGIEESELKDEKLLEKADAAFNIRALKSTHHFEDEGK